MIKTLTSFLNYGLFAEIALSIFAIVFVAIVIRTLLINSDVSEQNARIAIEENEEPTR